MTTEVLGAPVKRVEDARFTTGKGRYLDDIKLPSMAHVAVLRSPYAHANIKRIDTAAAKAMPGVIAVIVGADIPYNPLPMAWPAGGVFPVLTYTAATGDFATRNLPAGYGSAVTATSYLLSLGNVWIAKGSGNWDVATNWSLNHVPTALEDAVIPDRGTEIGRAHV
mgnify:CR=1 FL=1